MRHCIVADVMTTDVVAVAAATSFKDLAGLFVSRRISALPVIGGDGRVVGIICESDLLKKEELQQYPRASRVRWQRRAVRAAAAATRAADVMTAAVVTVRPETTVAEAARLMDAHHVKCLPVVDEADKLMGIVSPRDLLRVFLRPDAEIRDEIRDEVLARYLGTNPVLVTVEVSKGIATLTGEVERKSQLPLVLPLVRAVDGVVDAEARLTYSVDDTRHLTARIDDGAFEPPIRR